MSVNEFERADALLATQIPVTPDCLTQATTRLASEFGDVLKKLSGTLIAYTSRLQSATNPLEATALRAYLRSQLSEELGYLVSSTCWPTLLSALQQLQEIPRGEASDVDLVFSRISHLEVRI